MFLKDWWGKGRDGVRGWGGALWSWKQRMVQDRKRENPPEERVQSQGSRVLKPRWSTKGQICHFWSCPLNIPGKLILQLCHACPHIVENNTIATDISSKVDHVVLTWLCLCTSNLLACQWKALWWGLSHMFLSPAVWCSADRSQISKPLELPQLLTLTQSHTFSSTDQSDVQSIVYGEHDSCNQNAVTGLFQHLSLSWINYWNYII